MFESAELGHRIPRQELKRELPGLRVALLRAQQDVLLAARFPVVILMSGVEGAGKSETVNALCEWMDPRHIETHALDDPTDEERDRPPMWGFWRRLPRRGRLGIFIGSWYRAPIVDRAFERIGNAELDQEMDRILRFERMLADEGVLVIKFWLHLSQEAQRKRLRHLQRDPATRWRVTDLEWKHFKRYARFRRVSERALRQTSTVDAPWIVVEGSDPAYRSLTVAREVLERLRARLSRRGRHPAPVDPPALPSLDRRMLLPSLDLSRSISRKDYRRKLARLERRLNGLMRSDGMRAVPVVVVFEGPDAAGKGGCIRRITGALDARAYRVIPVAAPTDEERAHPYLWRFWRHLPRRGRVAIFDRSWYGRVLVERVEGLCSRADWMRAYAEIDDFEEQLVRHGTVVAKFWLQVSREEQLRRFQERKRQAFKRHKLTPEDWRNRAKWDRYERAACDMVDRTSTEIAPWCLVEADDKRFARIKVLKTLCRRLEAAL